MSTIVTQSNYGFNGSGNIVIQSFNSGSNMVPLDVVDQVDTSQFSGSWTDPYWPTLKSKYDLVMPGEPSSGGLEVPAS
jgi:hypothetical protein